MRSCPSPDELRRYLASDPGLGEERLAEIECHIERCTEQCWSILEGAIREQFQDVFDDRQPRGHRSSGDAWRDWYRSPNLNGTFGSLGRHHMVDGVEVFLTEPEYEGPSSRASEGPGRLARDGSASRETSLGSEGRAVHRRVPAQGQAPPPRPSEDTEEQDAPPEAAETHHGDPGEDMTVIKPLIGSLFDGRYWILQELTSGGMSWVFLAEDRALHRTVVVKLPRLRAGDDAEVIDRFKREARILASLDHPNLCKIHDVAEVCGVPYLTMPHIQGDPLSALVRQGPLDPNQAVGIVLTIAKAMAVAHRVGVVHRDLKPANVLMCRRQGPVVIDFGLALREEPGCPSVTKSWAVMGTLHYMSPEQVNGSRGMINKVTDIYALGVLMYELLTGRKPFAGDAPGSIMMQIESTRPAPPSSVRPGLKRRLDEVCTKAMAKDPGQRYESMDAFAAALKCAAAWPDLRLITEMIPEQGLPDKGNNMVVIAHLDGTLRVRVFDARGAMVLDTDEATRNDRAPGLERLKAVLDELPESQQRSQDDLDRVIIEVRRLYKARDEGRSRWAVPRRPAFAPVALLALGLLALVAWGARVGGIPIRSPFSAAIAVSTIADSGPGSLRRAILVANEDPGLDTIVFRLSGTGLHRIVPETELPAITDPVVLDGSGRGGVWSFGSTGAFEPPTIILDGRGTLDVGLRIERGGSGSIIRSIAVGGFRDYGILVRRADRNRIAGTMIGLSPDGSPLPNGDGTRDEKFGIDAGIGVLGGSGNRIGSAAPEDRNILSANLGNGIRVHTTEDGPTATGNVIAGNFIGTDADGAVARGNTESGIYLDEAPGNLVGGKEEGAGNLISANNPKGVGGMGAGVHIRGKRAVRNVIRGNLIGTDRRGAVALPNRDGIYLTAPETIVGGTAPGTRNLISGNHRFGIIVSTNTIVKPDSDAKNLIRGNLIGTDAPGRRVLRNNAAGITLLNTGGNLIGGTSEGAGNTIVGGEGGRGIWLYGSKGSLRNRIQGNRIGTDRSGTLPLGVQCGIRLDGSGGYIASGNVIGGTVPGAGNLIAGARETGIEIIGAGARDNVIRGNAIGTDMDGLLDLGGEGSGIAILAGAVGNLIGGTDAGAGNVIAHSGKAGIRHVGGDGNAIQGNSIHSSGGLGIDLGDEGVTPNDPGDGDSGPNALQNHPELASAMFVEGELRVEGALRSTPGEDFLVEFFAGGEGHPSGHGEGRIPLGTERVTTGAEGRAEFTVRLPAPGLPRPHVTATATDRNGNTSEFSGDVTAD